jgi:hypothetical protein
LKPPRNIRNIFWWQTQLWNEGINWQWVLLHCTHLHWVEDSYFTCR